MKKLLRWIGNMPSAMIRLVAMVNALLLAGVAMPAVAVPWIVSRWLRIPTPPPAVAVLESWSMPPRQGPPPWLSRLVELAGNYGVQSPAPDPTPEPEKAHHDPGAARTADAL